jgi:hypothetical protein
MQNSEFFLCSELMSVWTGHTVNIGNLEDICPDRCTIAIDLPSPVGVQVTIRCIECPHGKKDCTDCRFKGWVQCHENHPVLGCLMQIVFEGRTWSPEEWHPEHLTKMKHVSSSASA